MSEINKIIPFKSGNHSEENIAHQVTRSVLINAFDVLCLRFSDSRS